MSDDTSAYGHGLSVEACVRLHTAAHTRYLGDERKEKLEHALRATRELLSKAAQDTTFDTDQVERAQQLVALIERDISLCQPLRQADEDVSRNEP